MKQYIKDECKFLLQIASTENSGLHVFSFLSNSILKEILSAIQKGKPGAFSPGRPTEFLKNYKSSLDFLSHLEGYCPSRSAVVKFRAETVYAEFMKQWNIGVYFSLRFQEIAGALDSALIGNSLVTQAENSEIHKVVLRQSVVLLDCLRSCWRDDVLLISCSDKFLRLSLQLLSRYSNWLSAGLSARKAGTSGSNPGSEWAISALPDDFVYIIHDLKYVEAEVCGEYLEDVVKAISSCSKEVVDLIKQSILQGGRSLEDLVPQVLKSIVETLVDKCVEDLKHLRGISATYRMTNKPPPTRPLPYVSGVLRPLKVFLEGERAGRYLSSEIRKELVQGAATEITGRYHKEADSIVDVARKTESSLLLFRSRAQKRAGGSSDVSENNLTDADKLCMQLFLDIQEYGRNLSVLGVEAANIAAYRSLWQLVAPPNRQDLIQF